MTTPTEQSITEADMEAASEWAWRLANVIVMGRHGVGKAAVLIDRALARCIEAEAVPVAWLHTLHMEGGQTMEKLTDWDCVDPDEPSWTAFGRPGHDYSKCYPVTTQPLYTAPPKEPTDA
jgi:hypothetical protein